MNKVLKKSLPITLLVWPYLCIIPFWIESLDEEVFHSVPSLIYVALTVVVYLLNIINACTYKDEEACYKLAFWNMLIKLLHIPFYLCVFVLGVMFLLAAVLPVLTFITPFIVFMLFVIDLFLMITTSTYGVNALIRAGHKGIVSKKYAVAMSILHFFFIDDVISSIIVYLNIKKQRESE